MRLLTPISSFMTFTESSNKLRTATLFMLVSAFGTSAQAQDLNSDPTRFYNESAEVHKVLSFRFNQAGVDENSVSFLKSNRNLGFKNGNTTRKSKLSTLPEAYNFLLKDSKVYGPSHLKKSLELTANVSRQPITLVNASQFSTPNLETYKHPSLFAFTGVIKASPVTTASPSGIVKKSIQYADGSTSKTQDGIQNGIIETALLP